MKDYWWQRLLNVGVYIAYFISACFIIGGLFHVKELPGVAGPMFSVAIFIVIAAIIIRKAINYIILGTKR